MTGIAAGRSDARQGPGVPHDRKSAPSLDTSPALEAFPSARPWNSIPLRWQIFAAFVLASLLAGVVAAAVIVYGVRHAARAEIMSSMHLAERFVLEAVARTPPESSGPATLAALARELGELRHVRVLTTNPGSGRLSVLPPDETARIDSARAMPAWFARLMQVEDVRKEMRIGLGDRHIGSVILIGDASDEIAEAWEESKNLASVALAFSIAVAAILYVALGRVLHPLTSLAEGLGELERGQFRHRLVSPGVPELDAIAQRFNALAGRLEAAKADNERLTRRLITVQDDERRHIANELHDEIGPCLFGLKANIASLEQLVDQPAGTLAGRMRDRIRALGEISDQIQVLNRRLLTRIRPMALGHVPLADLVSGLVADFERVDPLPHITLAVGSIAPTYGDSIDLTVYRCLQEGITNTKRHSGANSIDILLDECPAETGSSRLSILKLSVQDDGRGFPPGTQWGFGLTGMDERVRALGGTMTIAGLPGGGTRLEVTIPLADNRRHIAMDEAGGTRSSQP